MHHSEEEEDLQIGCVINYDDRTKFGKILDPQGQSYDFDSSAIIIPFPILMENPWVIFTIVDSRATKIRYDANLTLKESPQRRGLLILGAAKCPHCDWRIPMFPETDQAPLRKRRPAFCPECRSLLKLKSIVAQTHRFALVIWVIIFLGTREIIIKIPDFYEEDLAAFAVVGLCFYAATFLSILGLYLQERLVAVSSGE